MRVLMCLVADRHVVPRETRNGAVSVSRLPATGKQFGRFVFRKLSQIFVHPVLGRKLKIAISISSSTKKPFVTIDEEMRHCCVKTSSVTSAACQKLCCSGDKTTENVSLPDGSTGLLIWKYLKEVTQRLL